MNFLKDVIPNPSNQNASKYFLSMKKEKFRIGDGVQLLSGSPHMTVIGLAKDGQIHCCWFDKSEKERRSKYPAEALVPEKLQDLTDVELNRRVNQSSKK